MSHYFTLEEANALIPTLERLLRQLKAQRAWIASKYSEFVQMREVAGRNGGHRQGGIYLAEIARYAHLIQEIQDHGCILKDINRGLIDFPALKDDREVYLCWMLGESSIQWWHERDAGFAGRQPIETL
jgi:hypothetical protein